MQVVSSREEFQWLLLVLMGFLLSLLPESFLWIGCLSAVILIGVPHGALDISLLWLEAKKNLTSLLISVSKYILLVFISLATWRFSSDLFWFCFFFAAIYHFGGSDEHPTILKIISQNSWSRALWILSRGAILVFAPAVFHSEKITHYLNHVSSPQFASGFSAVAPFVCAYSASIYLWTTLKCYQKASFQTHRLFLLKHLFSLIVFCLLFWVADPLVSFSLYFCCHHSLNHSFRVLQRNHRERNKTLYLLLLVVLLTLPIVPLSFWALKYIPQPNVPGATVTACFVAIAALTFPHLMVVRRLHEKLNWR